MTHNHTDDRPNTTDASVFRTDGGSEAEQETAETSAEADEASESASESEPTAESADEGDETREQAEPEAKEGSEGTEAEESTESEGETTQDTDDSEGETTQDTDDSEGETTQDTDDSEDHEETPSEPAAVEADDEAVVEQTGDVGVEPQHDDTEAEGAESDAESSESDAESSPAFDSEGGTASIIEVRNQVIELSTDVIGRSLDGIVEISRTDDAWRAVVEIIERRSVPDTQDILGQYEIELDDDGEVIGYRRLEKYRRADTGPSQR